MRWGAGIEFMRLDEIRERFGFLGVNDFVPAYGRVGLITDDTRMTLFTAEGLIRRGVALRTGESAIPPTLQIDPETASLFAHGVRPAPIPACPARIALIRRSCSSSAASSTIASTGAALGASASTTNVVVGS
jgi:ADP-ribosylglycohydrolase